MDFIPVGKNLVRVDSIQRFGVKKEVGGKIVLSVRFQGSGSEEFDIGELNKLFLVSGNRNSTWLIQKLEELLALGDCSNADEVKAVIEEAELKGYVKR